ncbi:MAG: FAD-binding oxidoreductase [Alphaproteobacteria bacterium]|nr:FAD-binding oxidoreductase [Alphaproteobacteria bacterium]
MPPPDPVPAETDVAVIGGGVVGLFAALFLQRAGRSVAVLERAAIWSDASGANAGTIAVQNKRHEVVPLTRLAIRLWPTLKAEYGIDTAYSRPGGLRVAASETGVARLRRDAEKQAGAGLEIEWLEGNRLRDCAPWLGPSVRAATLCPEDGQASPLVTGIALSAALRQRGVALCTHAGVHQIARNGAQFVLDTPRGPLRAGAILIAAGVWSADVAALLGARLPLAVDVNMLSATEPAPALLDRVVTHADGVLSLKQYGNGTCLIGGGWQGQGDVSTGTRALDYENLLHNMRAAVSVVPGLAQVQLLRSWAGFEAVAPDSLPLFGCLPGLGEAYIVAGARGAYSQGPALGAEVARLMLAGETELDLTAFAPGRFAA